ncbi:MAG TPA: type II toxin-antitoxin system HicB family antitoxin [Thermomicrobiales bacterium]|nr:type II toxin-antitoxin system HicB family antitoxin [Thermomicrobiales bacterium]
MKIVAVIHKAEEGGYWAEVPALPGCYTQGETLDEVKGNLKEAIELYLSDDTREPAEPGERIEIAV